MGIHKNEQKMTRRLFAPLAAATMLAFSSVAPAAFADEVADELAAQADALAVQADEVAAQADEVSAQISEKQQVLDEAAVQYEEASERARQANERKEQALAEKKAAEDKIAELQEKLSGRAVEMYTTDQANMLDLVFAARSFDDVVLAFDVMNKMNEEDAALVAEEKEQKTLAAVAGEKAANEEKIANEQAAIAEDAKSTAEAEIAELNQVYANLSDEVEQLLAERAAAQAEAESIWEAEYQAQLEAEAAAAAAAEAAAAESYDDGGYDGGDYDGGGYDEGDGDDGGSSSAYSNSGTSYAGADANDVVARAYSALGSDYVWGGVGGSDGGYDCSGLVSYAVSGSNTRLGTTNTFMGYEQTSNPQPGDIVTSSSHCGIYIGDGKMIHASDYGVGVIIGDVQSDMIAVKPQ